MKNLTIALDDESYRLARIRAAEQGTSISAMVKRFLSADNAPSRGVREMPMTYTAAPYEATTLPELPADKGPDGQPYFVNGKWVWTSDGKPRKPGAMRGMGGWTEDFDTWPDGFLDSMYGDDTPASNTWWPTMNDRLKTPDVK